jgi:hypothetical protein
MNCLECATRIARTNLAQPAIGCCTYCGAGICLDHARYIPLPSPPPVGLVSRPGNGRRRVVCTKCDPGTDIGALTISVFAESGHGSGQPPRRGWSALMSALIARDSRSRRPRATS